MKKIFLSLMIAISAIIITSCSAPKNVVYLQDLTTDSPLNIPPVKLITVKPEDKLNINVHCRDENIASLFNVRTNGTRSYSGTWGSSTQNGSSNVDLYAYSVDLNGNIDFPVVGKIHVNGLTRQQVANKVRDRLIEENLVKDPYVSCSFATAYYYTFGEIGGRGQIQIPKDAFTIVEAIAQAGDLSLQGVRTNIRVLREENGQLHSYNVDFTNAEDVINSPVYYIQPNDIIYVEPTKKQQYNTTAMGSSVLTPTFWMSFTSTVISLGLTIYSLTQRF